jgi:hypothetical protein
MHHPPPTSPVRNYKCIAVRARCDAIGPDAISLTVFVEDDGSAASGLPGPY